MSVNSLLVKSYAANIFLYGRRTFTGIPTEYHEPVKVYAAAGTIDGVNNPSTFAGYTNQQIDEALENGWITPAEHTTTIAIRFPEGRPTAG